MRPNGLGSNGIHRDEVEIVLETDHLEPCRRWLGGDRGGGATDETR